MLFEQDENADQSSEAWLKWRRKGLGSSDAPVIMGVSPWKTISQLWDEKVTGVSTTVENFAMTRGKQLEAFARDMYELDRGVRAPSKNVVHDRFEYMKCSLDGYVEEGNYGVEIKSPISEKEIEKAKRGIVSTKYIPQIEWQAFVCKLDFVDFVTYDGRSKIYVTRYWPNHAIRTALTARARWFWRKVKEEKRITLEEELLCFLRTKELFTSHHISLED